jgi:acylphosphatase
MNSSHYQSRTSTGLFRGFSAWLMESAMLVRKRLRITGRVQGVAFRASTVTTARVLGLAGWVANRADGSVEAVAEGNETGMATFIRWCHHGPPAARVDHVEVTDGPMHRPLPEPFTIH